MSEPINMRQTLEDIASKLDIVSRHGDQDELINAGITARNLRNAKKLSDKLQHAPNTKELIDSCHSQCRNLISALSDRENKQNVRAIHQNLMRIASPGKQKKTKH
ncbi:hypothetical protein GUITHDRAFT_121627 [Guillardia theta CCMP2712]|uniref:Uncharacterized protein n=1 Tax=Guillardia theta (strain CCMP2712) TaxID=905079 RepID=L1I8I1_GUITC|nr:hypothetical protein GUITHDRAFT_121627 [Guillardia theta CCMP2712]EKX32204.1 hypothetical protein GUITHDRAFT_121627 [Guillardia theta CCMP2712]|eukprot:XP_005819184.1 hypothetical protein GUITHDRAFT_121627 [Guillardia theta CCMP2712]